MNLKTLNLIFNKSEVIRTPFPDFGDPYTNQLYYALLFIIYFLLFIIDYLLLFF